MKKIKPINLQENIKNQENTYEKGVEFLRASKEPKSKDGKTKCYARCRGSHQNGVKGTVKKSGETIKNKGCLFPIATAL